MRKSFKNFIFYIWHSLGLPEPTPVQYDIADYLQFGPRRAQISAFRGVGKSYLTAAFVVWTLWNNPQEKIMVISAGKDRADAFSIFVKSLIENNDFLHHLKADRNKNQRDSNVSFDVGPATPSGSPSVKSVGITGQMTGSRANIIIADDIEVVGNSATHELREKLARLVTEFDAVLSPDGRIIYLGTPQNEMSLYNTLYNRGYDMRIWTARVPSEQQAQGYGAKLAPFIREMMKEKPVGAPVDPKRFDEEDLAERELSYGKSGFALQFMLDTSLSDALKFPLKLNDLIIYPVHPKDAPEEIYWTQNPLMRLKDLPNVGTAGQHYYAAEVIPEGASKMPYDAKVMTIDPSGRGEDETSYSVGFLAAGNIYCPDSGGFVGGYDDKTLESLCYIAKKHQVNEVVVESNFGDGMFTKMLTPIMNRIYPCVITEVRHNTQKERRIIDALEPVLNQHRLIIDPAVIIEDYQSAVERYTPEKATHYMMMYQMTRLSKDRGALRHDDRLEALAMMVQYFTDMLDNDQHNNAEKRKEQALDAMLENFMRECNQNSGKNKPIRLWRM